MVKVNVAAGWVGTKHYANWAPGGYPDSRTSQNDGQEDWWNGCINGSELAATKRTEMVQKCLPTMATSTETFIFIATARKKHSFMQIWCSLTIMKRREQRKFIIKCTNAMCEIFVFSHTYQPTQIISFCFLVFCLPFWIFFGVRLFAHLLKLLLPLLLWVSSFSANEKLRWNCRSSACFYSYLFD